jgi:arylsulfatase A-like enzyme
MHRARMQLEVLENRNLLSTNPVAHALLLSVDGLHQADIADPNLQPFLTNIINLQNNGVTYTQAHTTSPSDSFPGTLSYLTGAGPGTTGVYYDDSYSRTLLPPVALGGGSTPGTESQFAENIDISSNLINGGGNFDASSIDPNQLPRDPATGNPVFPNQFLQTNTTINTIFEVAHQAGLYTAFSDKHPAYQIANGSDPNSINDFYGPEINSLGALFDPVAGHTVSADTLLKTGLAMGFVPDVSEFTLVDASTDPAGASDANLEDLTHNPLLTEKYDDLKVQAIINEIHGQASHPSPNITNPQVPAIFGMNFQAVSVAEKYFAGGIVQLPDGSTAASLVLEAAIQHTDASIGQIVAELHMSGLWSSTDIFLTAKHGQAPRVGVAGLMADSTLPNLLSQAGASEAFTVQDDVSLIYLQNQSQTQQATQTLENFKNTGSLHVYFQGQLVTLPASEVIDQILSGPALVNAGLGNPATDATTPDIIVTLHPGFIWVGNPLHFTNKRAEHGGFSEDDTHIALIVSGGGVASRFRGTTMRDAVKTTQIAVTVLEALGLDPSQLTGASIEGTRVLPGLGFRNHRPIRASDLIFDPSFAANQLKPATNSEENSARGDTIVRDDKASVARSSGSTAAAALQTSAADAKVGVRSTPHGWTDALDSVFAGSAF